MLLTVGALCMFVYFMYKPLRVFLRSNIDIVRSTFQKLRETTATTKSKRERKSLFLQVPGLEYPSDDDAEGGEAKGGGSQFLLVASRSHQNFQHMNVRREMREEAAFDEVADDDCFNAAPGSTYAAEFSTQDVEASVVASPRAFGEPVDNATDPDPGIL